MYNYYPEFSFILVWFNMKLLSGLKCNYPEFGKEKQNQCSYPKRKKNKNKKDPLITEKT